ncbi:MAG: DUF1622 domain-containing protein [Rhizobiaceae bacterium]|nr:DUF1622 domain-containing protein [Rhizobiaceae bacterium]
MFAPAELLAALTDIFVPVIDLIALLFIAVGTAIAFWRACRIMFGERDEHAAQSIWLSYSRWLVAGLTFQLAADIIETSAAPDWNDIGRLAAVAVIRTFLNYFLERDQQELRERRKEHSSIEATLKRKVPRNAE